MILAKDTLSNRQSGFTLIELMISTGVFSVILLICTTAILVIGQQFHKASISAITQDTARTIMEDVSREVQLSGRAPSAVVTNAIPTPSVSAICVGTVRYNFILDYELEDVQVVDAVNRHAPHVLWKDSNPNPSSCVAQDITTPTPATSGRELMAIHTRLKPASGFGITNNDSTGVTQTLYNIDVSIIYGDNAVIDTVNNNCVSRSGGGSFCGLSELHTAVYRRNI